MTERPIPFSAPMVRALLGGSKTQTRRVVKPQPPTGTQRVIRPFADWRRQYAATDPHDMEQGQLLLGEVPACPYGQPGDRLWVREAWRTVAGADKIPPRDLMNVESFTHYEADSVKPVGMGKLRPGMFMPRWASRLLLEVTDVRVERLQDISEADAQAEGCDCLTWNGQPGMADLIDWPMKTTDRPWANGYALLWESINGDGSWAANPWVWAVSFKSHHPR